MSNSEEKLKKPIYKRVWFWIIIIVVVLAIVSGENDTTIVTSNGTTGEASNTTQQNKNKEVNVGDIVQTNNVKITYKSAQDYTQYGSYTAPQAGNKVIRVEFEFENISKSDVYLDGFECYADQEKCEEYFYAEDYKNSLLESLSIGKKTKAVLYYEVPENAKKIVLEYEADYWSNKKVEFIVK